MTVAELIAELQKHDPTAEVCTTEWQPVDTVARVLADGSTFIKGLVVVAHIPEPSGSQAWLHNFTIPEGM